ncbi:MAG: MaoC family dehydratase [Bacteroidetes bacterium]|nr:MaoC family dehydratase [Bacteroidota bacterium]
MNTYDSLQVGDSYSVKRTISAEDVRLFADLTGDDNPIHVDEEFAATTRFGKPIVHGVLLLGIISKVLGRDFPGHGSVAVSISARFLRPVPVGSEITVEVKVSEKIERMKHIRGKVYVYCGGKMALGGEATLIPPSGEESEPVSDSSDNSVTV